MIHIQINQWNSSKVKMFDVKIFWKQMSGSPLGASDQKKEWILPINLHRISSSSKNEKERLKIFFSSEFRNDYRCIRLHCRCFLFALNRSSSQPGDVIETRICMGVWRQQRLSPPVWKFCWERIWELQAFSKFVLNEPKHSFFMVFLAHQRGFQMGLIFFWASDLPRSSILLTGLMGLNSNLLHSSIS